jgi:hypothetical protein
MKYKMEEVEGKKLGACQRRSFSDLPEFVRLEVCEETGIFKCVVPICHCRVLF